MNHIIQRATLTETLLMGLHRSRGRSRGVGRRSRGVALAAEEFHFFDHFSVFFLKFFCAKEKNFPRACTEVAVGRAGTEGGRAGSRGLRKRSRGLRKNSTFSSIMRRFWTNFHRFFQNIFAPRSKISRGRAGIGQNEISKRGGRAGSRGCLDALWLHLFRQ